MVWDVTCSDTFASSYAAAASREPGVVAALSEERKVVHLGPLHLFTPVAVETIGVIGPLTRDFLKDLGRRLRHVTGEVKEHSYLLQRVLRYKEAILGQRCMGTLNRAIKNFFLEFCFVLFVLFCLFVCYVYFILL